MKAKYKLSFSLIALLLMANISFAQDGIELGTPTFGGSGCPQNSADVFLSPDQSEMFIRFEQYVTEAGGSASAMGRKSCNLAIPLHLPSGLSVSVIAVDYLGNLTLPRKATAQFNAEYFFAGSTGEKLSKTFTGKVSGNFHLQNDVVIESQNWSKCGEDTILRVNTSMLVKSNRKNEHAIAIVDGAALESGVIYKVQTRACSR